MSTGAIVTMVVGMLAIWGGLAASVAVTLSRSRAKRRERDGYHLDGGGP
jgi:hypothetical protein